jgi:deoxyribodipyrimidine photolyase-related protein
MEQGKVRAGGGAGVTLWILPDQLMEDHPGLLPGRWRDTVILMMESRKRAVRTGAHQVRLALEFAAMRHYAAWLRSRGWRVDYHTFADTPSYEEGLRRHHQLWGMHRVEVMEPSDWITRQGLPQIAQRVGVELLWLPNAQFLTSPQEFSEWAGNRAVLKMDSFYRSARRRTGVLMERDGLPVGGAWNGGRVERQGIRAWRSADKTSSAPFVPSHDELTREVIKEVREHFSAHPGDAGALWLPVTRKVALVWLHDFVSERLVGLKNWGHLMVKGQGVSMHSALSPLLNLGLLRPRECLEMVCSAWEAGRLPFDVAEFWAWQLLGRREFLQGTYRTRMPGYTALNELGATESLPRIIESGGGEMNCLKVVLGEILATGYVPFAQRLRILGNLFLLLGTRPDEVLRWFHAMLVDGHETVMAANVMGIALYADGGCVASKPCATLGSAIHQASDYCAGCRYKPELRVGAGACPFNLLYWAFWDRHMARFEGNPHLAPMLRGWMNRPASEKKRILQEAESYRVQIMEGR